MKNISITLLLLCFFAGTAFSQAAQPVTGKEYLKLSKKEREQIVASFIKDIKKQGVTVSKNAVFYCNRLDSLYAKTPRLLIEPVWKVLKTAMIMEYDWKEKGVDPDKLAKEWLGDKVYKRNKARL